MTRHLYFRYYFFDTDPTGGGSVLPATRRTLQVGCGEGVGVGRVLPPPRMGDIMISAGSRRNKKMCVSRRRRTRCSTRPRR